MSNTAVDPARPTTRNLMDKAALACATSVVLFLLLPGCATMSKGLQASRLESLHAKKSCCKSLSELPVGRMEINTRTKVELTELSPTFEFAQGKSYFSALSIPESNAPLPLEITVEWKGEIAAFRNVFCPTLTFLDASRSAAAVMAPRLSYARPGWFRAGHWRSVVTVPPGSTHVVVHTSADQLGGRLGFPAIDTGYTYSSGGQAVVVPGSGQYESSFPCAPTGELSLNPVLKAP